MLSISGNWQRFASFVYGRNRQKIKINKKWFFFGAGKNIKSNILNFRQNEIVEPIAIIDSQPKIDSVYGIPVISFRQFMQEYSNDFKNISIKISSSDFYNDIENQLLNNGFPLSNIVQNPYWQYFDLPFLTSSDYECFIDAGVFDGSSTIKFFKWLKMQNPQAKGKSYCFEANENLVDKISKNLEQYGLLQNSVIIPKGLWNEETTLKFDGDTNGQVSQNSEKGEIFVHTTTIDKTLANEKVTFIKMDIEGSELNALKGAERTIRKQKPKLAICIYHKPEDIFEIPEIILNFNPDYKLYIRHYGGTSNYQNYMWETVLYAI